MPSGMKRSGERVRSIFVSDLHLGSRFARVELLLEFLERYSPKYLYLAGDIVDGWCLRRRWHWPEIYNRLLDRFVEMAECGTTIRFTPGNHDEFLRRFLLDNELVCIDNQFVHVAADGRRIAVFHGDLFDSIETDAKWLSVIGGLAYETIMRMDYWTNRVLQTLGLRRVRLSQWVKQRVKLAVQFVSNFEDRVSSYALELGCDAAACGHIHVPRMTQRDARLYINLGDWVENSTALMEYESGRLELIDVERELVLAESPARGPHESDRATCGLPQWPRLGHSLQGSGICCETSGDVLGDRYSRVAPSYSLDP